ncbi:hypothetical protein H4Q32_015003 [Labeo rohita]|uniref:Uncharacterized protein n=1 Tax=Labeo rohita TaxID=84645 RepID=A0ABQ8LP24_LABRO|nr:hypothetical protein H4Q32_015003 [Labeo rohita]
MGEEAGCGWSWLLKPHPPSAMPVSSGQSMNYSFSHFRVGFKRETGRLPLGQNMCYSRSTDANDVKQVLKGHETPLFQHWLVLTTVLKNASKVGVVRCGVEGEESTFISAFTVLCGARTDLPDRHMCCVFWLNIAAAFIQIVTAIVMVGWIMSIFWGMDMVILARLSND